MNNKELQAIKQRYDIVGNYDGLNRALEMALKVAKVDLSVLVIGENGVGKEVFSRIIHEASPRRGKPFLAINCGALPEGTIDSELFGHVKGAFTGSVESREGHFASADGGTLFLDEVGELPLQTQVRLLRVLETGEFIPVGSSEVRRTNVRIVAATNVDMERAIAQGKFRQDLYYRLSAVHIKVPALRERGQDIDTLFRKFALEMSERYHVPTVRLNPDAKTRLLSYDWPGNIRQLRNVAESMSVTLDGNHLQGDSQEVSAEQLEAYIPDGKRMSAPVPLNNASPTEQGVGEQMQMVLHVVGALRHEVENLRREVDQLKAERQTLAYDLPAATLPHKPQSATSMPIPVESLPSSATIAHGNIPTIAHNQQSAPAISQHSLLSTNGLTPHNEDIDEAIEIIDHGFAASHLRDELPTRNDMERELIIRALEKANGHRKTAAEQIGISERTLYRKIKDYGIEA